MTQDEFQSLVLQELKGIKSKIDSLETRLDTIETRLDSMETRLDALETRMDIMDARLERVENKQIEQGDILSALLHNQEVARAEIESLKATTANSASIRRLDIKFSILNNKILEQETDIQELKLAK